jgi:hypothetical protein
MPTESIDDPLMQSPGGPIGYMLISFIVSMAIGYALLRIAGSSKRSEGVAIALRLLAILIAGYLTYASHIGGGMFDAGGAVAVVVIVIWVVIQQRRTVQSPK